MVLRLGLTILAVGALSAVGPEAALFGESTGMICLLPDSCRGSWDSSGCAAAA